MARPLVAQSFNTQVLVVGMTPTPLSSLQLTQAYIDSLILCLYSTAANSIFYGDQGVTTGTGLELPVGVTIELSISNARPAYELQDPLDAITTKVLCQSVKPFEVPFVYWDLTQLYAIAAAPTNIVIAAVKRAWV